MKGKVKEYLQEDRKRMLGNTKIYHIIYILLTQNPAWIRWIFIKNMRLAGYHEQRFLDGSKLSFFPMIWYSRRRNIIGNKLGFEIGADCPKTSGLST